MADGNAALTGGLLLDVIFERSAIGIAVIGSDYRVRTANPAARRLFGFSTDELRDMSFLDVFLPEERDEIMGRFRELVAGERDDYQVDRRCVRKDGSQFWGRITISIERGGAEPLIVGIVEDVTARKAATLALGERVKELTCLHATARLMLDQSIAGLERLHRVAALLPPALQHPELATASIEHGDTVFSTPGHGGTPWFLAAPFETVDGTRGAVAVAYRERPTDDGSELFLPEERALLASIADMVRASLDREIASTAIGQANERLNLALTTAGMGFWEWDLRSSTVRWSSQLARMVGLEGDLVGTFKDFIHLVHPDDQPMLEQFLLRAAAEEMTRGTELRLRRVDGGWRPMVANTGRFLGPDRKPARVIASVLDVTERRVLEEGLRQAQKLEALGQVAGGVAHDFNNLLTVMLAGAEVLRMDMEPDHKWRELVDDMYNAAENGTGLTRQLLSFSRKATYQPSAVDVDGLLRRNESLFARLAGRRVKLALTSDGTAGRVWADQTQLEQVFMNLVVNARDAMADTGGTISISTATASDELVARAGLDAGTYTLVSVKDTGPGIPEDVLARLFEPFFTTKEAGKGTGLGLAVVSGVARQWNGAVVVDSVLCAGATFHVLLPRLA